MAREFTVKIRLSADDKASAEVTKVEKSLGGLETRAGSVTAALGVAAAAFAGLAVVTKASVSAAAEEEEALARLDSALRLTGTTEFAQALRDQAEQLQATTRFSDDAVNSAQALIATYGVAGDQLAKATQAAADLSARLGIDLNTAAQQVAATTNGVTRGLDRIVPALKGLSDEALRSGEGINILAEAMRGGAVEAAQTFQGEIDKTRNALDEMLASFSRAAIASDKVGLAFQFLRGLIGAVAAEFGSAEVAVGSFATTADRLSDAMQENLDWLDNINPKINAHREAVERANRINGEWSANLETVGDIAKRLGVTISLDLNEALALNRAELDLINDLYSAGQVPAEDYAKVIKALGEEQAKLQAQLNGTGEALGDYGEALDGATSSTAALIAAQRTEITTQRELAQAIIFTAQAFDFLARTQGRGVATEAAVAAGGRTILGGTRVLLPGGGSRLTSEPGFGRFGSP